MTSIKEALKIIQRTIKGDQIEAAVVDVGTMMPLGKVVSDALAQLDSADARGIAGAARKCADDLANIVEASVRVAHRTGNSFLLDRNKTASMIAGYFTGLLPDAGPGNGAEKVREALARIPPDLFWLIGKGRLSPNEPMYAAQIKIGLDTISEAEHDDLATAINLACDRVALHSTSAAGETRPTMPRGGVEPDWHAESVKLYRQNKALRTALQEQHDWHLAQGDKDFGDDITLNMADEYSDSGMCERTTSILSEVLPSGVQGYEAWKSKRGDAAGETTSSDGGGCMADFSSGDPNNLKELMAGPSVFDPPSEAADVLAMKEACKRAVSECLNQYGRMTFVTEKGWSGLEGQIRAAIDKLSPEGKAEGKSQDPVAVAAYLHRSKHGHCPSVSFEKAINPDWTSEPLYTHPASPPDVEAIARIIDPEAFEKWDDAQGSWRKDEAKVACWPAEEKADAIAALIAGGR